VSDIDLDRYRESVLRCNEAAAAASGGALSVDGFAMVGGTHEYDGLWTAGVLALDTNHGKVGFTGWGDTEDEAIADMCRQVTIATAPPTATAPTDPHDSAGP
jgi:hypothetical protein